MSSLDHYDVPWPDYLFAGKPPSGIPSWRVLHADLLQHARRLPYAERFDRMLYASKLMHTDRSVPKDARAFFASYMPLRHSFTRQCLEQCGLSQGSTPRVAAASGLDATASAGGPRDFSSLDLEFEPGKAMASLRGIAGLGSNGSAGGSPVAIGDPGRSDGSAAAGWQFKYKCTYQSILLLQGRSAWLDHFKMEMACGSLVVFASDRTRPRVDRLFEPMPAHSFWSHLLRANEHYIHVDADHALRPQPAAQDADTSTGMPVRRLCAAVQEAQQWAHKYPSTARCIGARGQVRSS